MAKKNSNTVLIIGAIAVFAIVLIYMGSQGMFKSVLTLQVPGGVGDVTPRTFEITPTDPTCTFSLDKLRALVGEDVTGTIRDGALKSCVVAYNYEDSGWVIYNVEVLDINGMVRETQSATVEGTYIWTALCGYFEGERFIAECRTNDVTIEILPVVAPPEPPPIPPDEGPQPGDTVGSGSGSGTLGDDEFSHFEIQFVPTEHQFDMCAEIERKSSKVDPNCNPTGDLEDWANFNFLDSYTTVWERNDQIFAGVVNGPDTYGNPDVVRVYWDGVAPFRGYLHHFGDCDMTMQMRVTIVVCE